MADHGILATNYACAARGTPAELRPYTPKGWNAAITTIDFVDLAIAYDRNSNITSIKDAALGAGFDVLHAVDGVKLLVDAADDVLSELTYNPPVSERTVNGLASLLAPGGALARRLDGFEVRPEQLRMVEAVESALAAKRNLVVEAGTGVGKSFAYLLPAIRRIVDRQRPDRRADERERIVICTHTISLQEQLVQKDIPLLQAVLPDEFTAVLVKGRGNYVSLRRLERASRRQDRLFADEGLVHRLHQLEDWAQDTRDGSLSDLGEPPPPPVWESVVSDSDNCLGRRCPTYGKCFYQAARRRMENADLLICNHALFFSDLALRSADAGFLPPYSHVILDEAHTVEEVASEHFGLRITEGQVAHLFRSLHDERTGKGLLAVIEHGGVGPGVETAMIDAVGRRLARCRDASTAQFARLHEAYRVREARGGRLEGPGIVDDLLSDELKRLADSLSMLREAVENEEGKLEVAAAATRAEAMSKQLAALLSQSIDECVYWIETAGPSGPSGQGGHSRSPRLVLRAAPVEVAPLLRKHLFTREGSVILASATVTTAPGDFSHLVGRLGCEDAQTLQLGSPFDFAKLVTVHIESDLPDPGEPRFTAAIGPRILEHIEATDGGAFVLFTSYKMLREVSDRIRGVLTAAGHPVLVHGESEGRTAMVERFRADRRSVLFGTASFWQGVDVRGDALRNVIIVRLPFEVPDRPLVQARHERIRERGGNPFRDDTLPQAVIRFRQGFGRLVRSSTDSGRVVVLDRRMATKSYGRLFRAALPAGVKIVQRTAEA